MRFVRNNYIASADYKQSLETITTTSKTKNGNHLKESSAQQQRTAKMKKRRNAKNCTNNVANVIVVKHAPCCYSVFFSSDFAQNVSVFSISFFTSSLFFVRVSFLSLLPTLVLFMQLQASVIIHPHPSRVLSEISS